jgi:hypothetical protein
MAGASSSKANQVHPAINGWAIFTRRFVTANRSGASPVYWWGETPSNPDLFFVLKLALLERGLDGISPHQ